MNGKRILSACEKRASIAWLALALAPVIAASSQLTGCSKPAASKLPLEERLLEPDAFLIFDYEDFGPVIHTRYSLGKPEPTEDTPSKKTAKGWDVGNVKVIVSVVGTKEKLWAMLEDTGWFQTGIDYRMVWYYDIVGHLEDIIGNDEIEEAAKAPSRATLEKILDAMGDKDEVRARMQELEDRLDEWADENMVRGRRTEIGRRLRAKGLRI